MSSRPPDIFVTTLWSRVVQAGSATEEPAAHDALASLCRDYWRPLFHFARRRGHSNEDAQDLTQGFLGNLLERKALTRADPERGRFRTFLLSAFTNYMANWHRDQAAQKRGGGLAFVSINETTENGPALRVADGATPEMLYERSWAMALLERVMERLREDYARAGRAKLFEALQPSLSSAGERVAHVEIGLRLGLTESAVSTALHRMRRRYGELLREEIAATVADPSEVDDELRHLRRIMAGGTR